MDLIITILPVVTKDLPISPRLTPYDFLSRCKFSTLTTRQPMVELRGNNDRCLIRNSYYIFYHLYTGGDHHCHVSTGAVLIMQRKIIALDLNDELACAILGTTFHP